MSEPSKTRTSFYRRLYVAHLISQGTDTVPAIMAATGRLVRSANSLALANADTAAASSFVAKAWLNVGSTTVDSARPITPNGNW